MIQLYWSSTHTFNNWLKKHPLRIDTIKQLIREEIEENPQEIESESIIVPMKTGFNAEIHYKVENLVKTPKSIIFNVVFYKGHAPAD